MLMTWRNAGIRFENSRALCLIHNMRLVAASGRWPGRDPLFTSAGAVLMGPDDGGVDHRVFVVGIFGQGLEKILLNAFCTPTRDAPVGVSHRRARAKRATARQRGISRSRPRRKADCHDHCCAPPCPDGPAANFQSAQTGRPAIHSVSSQSLLKEGSL